MRIKLASLVMVNQTSFALCKCDDIFVTAHRLCTQGASNCTERVILQSKAYSIHLSAYCSYTSDGHGNNHHALTADSLCTQGVLNCTERVVLHLNIGCHLSMAACMRSVNHGRMMSCSLKHHPPD